MYSSKPAATVMVRDLIAEKDLAQPEGRRRLNAAGLQAVDVAAERMAVLVDELLGKKWDRQAGTFVELQVASASLESTDETGKVAACSCGSGIPVQKLQVKGQEVTLIALPLIFEQFKQAGKMPSSAIARELLDAVKIYNPIPQSEDDPYLAVLLQDYIAYCEKEAVR
jgi:hypothetical protein